MHLTYISDPETSRFPGIHSHRLTSRLQDKVNVFQHSKLVTLWDRSRVDIGCRVKESPDSTFHRVYPSCKEGSSLLPGIIGSSLFYNVIIIQCLYSDWQAAPNFPGPRVGFPPLSLIGNALLPKTWWNPTALFPFGEDCKQYLFASSHVSGRS